MPAAERCALVLTLCLTACTGSIELGPAGARGAEANRCALPVPEGAGRRLTRAEIAAGIEDALGVTIDVGRLVSDEVTGGFASNAIAPISEREIDAILAVAEDAAAAALDHALPVCADDACVGATLDAVAPALSRRRLEEPERAALVTRAAAWRASFGARDAMVMLATSLVISPRFLYVLRVGTGEVREDGAERLSDATVAELLALLLTGRAPDDALLDAVHTGTLSDPVSRAAHAARLAASDVGRRHAARFFSEWLDLPRVRTGAKDDVRFPFWSPELARSMEADGLATIETLLAEGGGVHELLTTDLAFVDVRTAPLYGVPASDLAPSGLTRVRLPWRHGVLTFPAFLAGHANAADPSWVQRGLFVRQRLLCDEIEPPPPGIDFGSVAPESRASHPTCGSCHRAMDPIGRGLDAFDAAGLPHDVLARGEVIDEDPSVAGAFEGATDLSDRLAESPRVHACMTRQAYRFAHRRLESRSDRCAIADITARWRDAGGQLDQLLVAIAADESFVWAESPNPASTSEVSP